MGLILLNKLCLFYFIATYILTVLVSCRIIPLIYFVVWCFMLIFAQFIKLLHIIYGYKRSN